jgi:hypothetical protein
MMYFSKDMAMKANALQNAGKLGVAGCHMNGTVASNSNGILRTTNSVTAATSTVLAPERPHVIGGCRFITRKSDALTRHARIPELSNTR